MKKLNRKGFTLIELLAVIVILAIVVVVTIPSVLKSINNAKESSLSNATATVTEWFTKQRELETLGQDLAGSDLTDAYTKFGLNKDTATPLTEAILKEAGITNPKGLTGTAQLKGEKVCIILNAGTTSQFYVKDASNGNSVTGSGC